MGRKGNSSSNKPQALNAKQGELPMFGIARRVLAVASFSICTALPAMAQETVRIRGTVERSIDKLSSAGAKQFPALRDVIE